MIFSILHYAFLIKIMRELLIKYWYKKFPPEIPSDYHRILNAYSHYYQNLNEKNQSKFRYRLFILLKLIRFIPKDLPHVTTEMKVVIGSAIIQITFGLNYFLLKHFNTIYVVPRPYRFPGYKDLFLGHVDFKYKVIVFSWQDVKNGYFIPNDAVNVALHEMAHCLEKENKFRQLFHNFFDEEKWNDWAEEASQKMETIRQGENNFIKSYGGKNMQEMFAVCIETFFEKPKEFKTYLPKLYDTMTNLLNQDPTISENPVLSVEP